MATFALRSAAKHVRMLVSAVSQAKRDAAVCPGSRGNALSRGPMPSFLRRKSRGHMALTLHGESLLVVRCW